MPSSQRVIGTVRTHLLWDAFMPTPSRVEPARQRNFEHFLGVAADLSLQVIPVLFIQTLGGCVMLPTYAIDVGARRRGVRAVTDAVTQPGGPRYVYTDQLMLEVCARWIDEMLGAFAGHPAISMWDIGHDPAGGVRPQRIEHLRAWTAMISERIHAHEQRCMMSLSADDVVIARAVRPALIASMVDVLGIDLGADALALVGGVLEPAAATFLAQLAESLSDSAPLVAHLHPSEVASSVEDDAEPVDEDAQTRRYVAGAVDALVDCGCTGLMAAHVEQSRSTRGAGTAVRPHCRAAPRRCCGRVGRGDGVRRCVAGGGTSRTRTGGPESVAGAHRCGGLLRESSGEPARAPRGLGARLERIPCYAAMSTGTARNRHPSVLPSRSFAGSRC